MRYPLALVCLLAVAATPAQSVTWQTNPANLHDYALVQTDMTWPAAAAFARTNGAHLAVVRNAAENAWLAGLLPTNTSAWIGLERVGTTWHWATREPLAYTNWAVAQGQPSGGATEIYGRMLTTTAVPGVWDDTQSAATHWFLLERSAELNRVGVGCTGSAGVPDLDSTGLPRLGQTLTMQFTNLPAVGGPVIAFAGLANVPVPLPPIGMPGCVAQFTPVDSAGLFQAGGSTTWPVTVPDNVALLGLRVYLQAYVYDLGVNALDGTVTNAVEAVLWH